MAFWKKKDKRSALEEGDMASIAEAGGTSPEVEEDSDLPSVNRKKGGNKMVTYLGYAFILLAAGALIYAANAPKGPKKKKDGPEQLTNSMPRLEIPKTVAQAVPKPPQPVKETPAPAQPIPVAKNGAAANGTAAKPEQTWYERKMAGPVLVGGNGPGQGGGNSGTPAGGPARLNSVNGEADALGGPKNDLAVKLEPTVTKAVAASMLPDRNFLLTKGTALDCALETAIDSTLPGMTTCRLTRDVYSDNGQVIVLDRGSQLVGEYVGGLKNGQARLFVLWTRAKTPNGVVVSLNSPGTDALGRSGHEGWVDNHWIERFGAAVLMSVVKDTMAAVIARQSESRAIQQSNSAATGATVVYGGGSTTNPYANTMSGGEQIISKILDATANIPPTLMKNQGDHIQVMVARDLDFSAVYSLQAAK
jgi:type IV secretion system protein VirB10